MPNGDRTVLGLPCRFPAKPSIFTVCCAQVFDHTRFFGLGEPRKNFYPGFPCAAGNGRGDVAVGSSPVETSPHFSKG